MMEASVGDGMGGLLEVTLDAEEAVLAAAGALVDHTGDVRIDRSRAGAMRSVANTAREREVTPVRVRAVGGGAVVRFAPDYPGEIAACELGAAGGRVSVAWDGFVAAPVGVSVGARSIGNAPTRGMGLLMTQFTGERTVYVAGRGRVERVALAEGDSRVVAAANVVAFEDRVRVAVERVSAMEDAASVGRFHGPGTVWVATR
ncbi:MULTISPECIES: AIM24 family protein [Halobacterium]|uniref:DUF124 family protein n=8 Tax=Halobacterium salinarum TaxID=2242 RepID=Q9HMA6_HALSA|nr:MULTISPECIES: AIM24 family protein [Halobacterium]AAG20665.1 hypothetical protein VNG_2631H [Halobacterium salinarum NRC-1]MBB6089398.1 uncharacterized protein (AIM24 family) [Halobacterium salinarum]MCF2164618.1 AIM24 family protein [Halobacterium salinarum]MCF2166936.1 AIM24 family protein [Halobacterium salinarum]MCF2238052.1 AIM24 family protein [Halobacterium salinarum]